jgi:hypothetical protein
MALPHYVPAPDRLMLHRFAKQHQTIPLESVIALSAITLSLCLASKMAACRSMK